MDPQTSFCEIELSTELDARAERPSGAWRSRRARSDSARAGSVRRRRDLRSREASTARCRLPSTLLLADAQRRTVQVVLHQDAWGAARFECYSLDSDTAASPGWSLLASGAVAADEADRPDGERHPPELIAASCPDVITGSSFYHRLAEHGLQYGPGFAAVEQIWRRDGEAVARLTPPDADHDDFADGRILDAAFQALAATLATTEQVRDTYLPVGVGELRTSRDNHRRNVVPRAAAPRLRPRAGHHRGRRVPAAGRRAGGDVGPRVASTANPGGPPRDDR